VERELSGAFNDRIGLTVTFLLLVVALASVAALWTLDTTTASAEAIFAIYLAVDLVTFAMISYIYRLSKTGDPIRKVPMLAGCVLLLLLVAAGFLA
jgi:hypothetical protein